MFLIFDSVIQKICINYLGAFHDFDILYFQFNHLLNLTNKGLLSVKTLLDKTGQIRRCQGLEKLGRHVETMRSPHNVFYQLRFKKTTVLFPKEKLLCEKHKLFTNVFTTIYWVKLAWPAEPIFLTWKALSGDAGRDG